MLSAVLLAIVAAGIAITTASTMGATIIVGLVMGISYWIFMNPDGSFDYWVEISDIYTFIDKYYNWWPYDFGIMDSYAGLNRNEYIPIPYVV